MPSPAQNPRLKHTLLSAVQEGRLAGCYMIEGDKGTGKRDVALWVAAALLCPHPHHDHSPCGICPVCQRIYHGGHVDVIEALPENEGKTIPVDQVREILKESFHVTSEGDWRVFIFPNAEDLNKASQNALLKSIEEPRPNTVFFLLTADRSKLLPTVRSRAVHYRTEPMKNEEIRNALTERGIPSERAEEIALLSQGSLGLAIQMAQDGEVQEIRRKVLSYYTAILDGAGFTKLSLILPPSSTTRKELLAFLAMAKSALRDLMLENAGERHSPLFFIKGEAALSLSQILSATRAVKLFSLIEETQLAVAGNANLFSALSRLHLCAKDLTR